MHKPGLVARICNPSIEKWGQEDGEFKVIFGYAANLRSILITGDSVSTNKLARMVIVHSCKSALGK